MGTLKEVPEVELGNAFEPDYFVGPPLNETHSRPNPWKSPLHSKTQRKYIIQLDDFDKSALISGESPSFVTEPVPYTPCHPSQMQENKSSTIPVRSNRGRPRKKHPNFDPSLISSTSHHAHALEPPLPIYLQSANNFQLVQPTMTLRPETWKTPPPPPISLPNVSRPQMPAHSYSRAPNYPPRFTVNDRPLLQPARFAGAPNFTTYGNGTPRMQTVNEINYQYFSNSMRQRLPIPAHSVSNPNQDNNIRPGINVNTSNISILRPQVRFMHPTPVQTTPNPVDFDSKAQPVRPALDDFMRHVSNAFPGLDMNQLINQARSLPVQPGFGPVPGDNQNFTPEQVQHQQQYVQQAIQVALLNIGPNYQQRLPSTMHPMTTPPNMYNYPRAAPPPPPPPSKPTEDDMALQDLEADAARDEEYHEVETYSDYVPAKLNIGCPHPDPVVETSSLSTVEPPDVTYELNLPKDVIDNGLLSSLQLESVIYASQQHMQLMPDGRTRRGFLIGDGAGVGKGRTIAGIIYENYLCGRRKSIWLSVSTDLKLDAERDLRDIGARTLAKKIRLLKEFTYGKKINLDEGVIFTTYSGLVSRSQSVRGNLGNRLGQLVAWVGSNFDGVIVFDECHKAKNITKTTNSQKISKAAEYVLEIQTKLPNARVVYASATGASETRHLGYMTRLGIWGEGTAYPSFGRFCEAIEKRGVGAMELVAVDLKMRGSYIARQLSFKTTSFEIRFAKLDEQFIKLYDDCVDLWSTALQYFRVADSYCCANKKLIRTLWSSFWAAHQKFFKYLCISAKVPVVVEIAKQALLDGKCVVVGLQSTGEAKTLEALEDGDINEFVSTAKATFESLIENHFPAPGRRPRRTVKRAPSEDSEINFRNQESSEKQTSETNNSGGSSSSSTVDELWASDYSCKFVVKDGVVLPLVEEPKSNRNSKSTDATNESSSTGNRVLRNQKVLEELVNSKKAEEQAKSSRSVRAKRRATLRRGDKSRIKKATDSDSDTEISNPLSSCSSEHQLSFNSDETYQGESESEDDDDETIYEDSGSDDELSVIATKAVRGSKKKRNLINDDSDSDIQITAVKAKKHCEIVTIVSDDDDEDDDEDESLLGDGADRDAKSIDPLIVHGPRLTQMRDELLAKIDDLGPRLPNNTLDDLIDRLGGPSEVAEMTGRKGRVVKDSHGRVSYKQRNEIDHLDIMNIAEKNRFMNGEKFIAIISEAASSGISLQADKRVANTRRRVHITIELPWSADRAIQQFGRTHRSNQLSGPEYVFIISELAGERRFASIVAKRLESLGALTHGDRRANTDSRDLSQFNIASRYCKHALELLARLLECDVKFADIDPVYPKGNFIQDARAAYAGVGLGRNPHRNVFIPEPFAVNINLFLNRILGMKVHIQNAIFKLFTDYTERLITRKKVSGQYDAGILELNPESGKAQVEAPEHYYLITKSGKVQCTLRHVKVERGITWENALDMYKNRSDDDKRSGFYVSKNPLTGAKLVFLMLREGVDLFRIYKPNTGKQPKPEFYQGMMEKQNTFRASDEEAERIWRHVYTATDDNCVHLCFFKNCKRIEAKMKCDVGLRHRYYCILSGSILTAWPYLEKTVPEATKRINIVRLRLDVHNRVIGPIIPQDFLDKVRKALREAQTKGVEF